MYVLFHCIRKVTVVFSEWSTCIELFLPPSCPFFFSLLWLTKSILYDVLSHHDGNQSSLGLFFTVFGGPSCHRE